MERINKITEFLTICYCQHCRANNNRKCNIEKLTRKYQSNSLNFSQASGAKLFSLDEQSNKCSNYVKPAGMFLIHAVEISCKGKKNEIREWLTNEEISELWCDSDVEDVDILFTEIETL